MAGTVAASVQNLEEAANLASDLITSLDNLPSEVQHLLNEIRLKDRRCQELQQDIAKDQAKYIKYSLRQDPAVPSPAQIGSKLNSAGGDAPGEAPQVSTQNKLVPKAHLPARIAASYVEIDALSNEKVVLAQRLIDLITRTRARVDANLVNVQVLQGESVSTPYSARRPEGMSGGLNLVAQSGEGVRALTARTGLGSADSSVPSTPPAMVSGPSYNKKRRITTNTSIKLQSPTPSTPQAAPVVSYPKSRLSRQVQLTRSQQQQEEDLDADAEGEEDLEGEDAEDDLTPYCFCHKPSFGDMIGCDNLECPYQWFHISCVGVKTPLPDKWYCPECVRNRSAVPERRKARKK